MLRRDYLLKLIQDLFAAISALLDKDGDEVDKQRRIESLYTLFGANADFFREASVADIVSTVAQTAADGGGVPPDEVSKSEMEQRLELLASLLYADFKVSGSTSGLKADVAERALELFLMVDKSSDTYSFERLDKIGELKAFLFR